MFSVRCSFQSCLTTVVGANAAPSVFQLVSGALSVSAAQSIFANVMVANLPKYAPGIDPAQVFAVGSTEIRKVFTAAQVPGILQAYLAGLKAAWAMGIGLAGLTVFVGLLPERKSIKGAGGGGWGAAA